MRGLALVVVVGVLGILALLASAFVTLSRLERRASTQRVSEARAALLARAGLEDALARLSAGQDPARPGCAYGGEDWDGDGRLDALEAASEAFRRTGAGTPADLETCPAECAMRPSFASRDALGRPRLRPVDARLRGVSGMLGEDGYALKVEDESGKISINGGLLDGGDRDADGVPDCRDADVPAGWNRELAGMLGTLAVQPGLALPPTFGTDLLSVRPEGGYASVLQMQGALGIPGDLTPYLTSSCRPDAKVVRPNAFAGETDNKPVCEVKKQRGPLALEEGGRPPVNLNTAPKEVLVAIFQGLEARSWGLGALSYPAAVQPAFSIDAVVASDLAEALVSRRPADPLDTWGEVSGFLDGLTPAVIKGGGAGLLGALPRADLVKAALDPNTRLTKQHPDQLLWRWVDKSDLLRWTTEGALCSSGVFTVSSVGRVVDPTGRTLASCIRRLQVDAYTLLRQTTQRDFVAGRTALDAYLKPQGMVASGRSSGASAAWNSWGAGTGLSVMSYPCSPPALPAQAAEFDGVLALATLEHDSPMPGLMFLHHVDDAWDGERVSSNPTNRPLRIPGPADGSLQTDLTRSVWPDAPGTEPSTLLPDGIQLQRGRCPAFEAQGNCASSLSPGDLTGSDHGIVGFWAKPVGYLDAMDPGSMGGGAGGGYRLDFSCIRPTSPTTTQSFLIGRRNSGDVWGVMFESSGGSGENPTVLCERMHKVKRIYPGFASLLPGFRWHYVAVEVDSDSPSTADDVSMSLRGITAARPPELDPPYDVPFDPLVRESLVQAGVVFMFGSQDAIEGSKPCFPNAVIDEFVLYNFGDLAPMARGSRDLLAREQYMRGRYYRGGDGAFLSGVLDPGNGASGRLLRSWWTGYLPQETRQELCAGDPSAAPFQQARAIEPALQPAGGVPKAWLELELLDAAGDFAGPALCRLGQGESVQRDLAAFRYRVRFRTSVDPLNVPVLESPWLDDVTFAWQAASGPRVLRWGAP